MSKNKIRNQAKQKQKDALRTKHRVAAHRPIQKPKSKLPEFVQVTQEKFPDESYLWWLAQGINHILSDYKEGLWTPLFPEIYETWTAPAPEQIAQRLMAKYEGVDPWPLEGTTALAWSVQNREMVFAYYTEIIRQMKALAPEHDPDELSRRPHNASVWRLFESLKTKQRMQRLTHKH
jgi:hypothetical protein